MLMLSKHSINKKKMYFLACFTKRLYDFKNTIFKTTLCAKEKKILITRKSKPRGEMVFQNLVEL
jgi:hypothetical protein